LRQEVGADRTLTINSGNLTRTTTKVDFEIKYRVLQTALKGYDMIGVEVFTPGVQELIYGREMINKLHEYTKKSAIICANLAYPAPGIEPSRLFTVNHKKILVTSIFDPKFEKKAIHGLKASDPIAALNKALKTPHDLAIAVLHFSDNKARNIIRRVAGLNIAVLATQRGVFRKIELIKGCCLVKNNNHGKTVGYLDWNFSSNSPTRLKLVKVEKSTFKADPKVAKLVDEYEQWLRKHYIKKEKQEEETLNEKAAGINYVGNQACGTCHPKITASWQTTRHARAYASLQKKCKDYCPDCLPCHVTGSRQHNKKGFQSPASTPNLFNVQCEECHGPAQDHIKDPKLNYGLKIDKKTCTACHNSNTDPEFSFAHDLPLISH